MANQYPPQPQPQPQPQSGQPFTGGAYPPPPYGTQYPLGPAPKKPLWKKKRFFIPAGILALMIISGIANGGKKTEPTAAPSPAATQSAEAATAPLAAASGEQSAPSPAAPAAAAAPPVSEFGAHPSDQTAFLAAFEAGKTAHSNAGNDLQKAKAITDRDTAMCAAIGGAPVGEWTGKITSIGANNDGYAHIDVRLSKDVEVKTWNNALSDYSDNTLIKPGALYDSILQLKEGQTVVFSGEFVPKDASCLQGTNLTDAFYAVDPDLLFRFSAVRAG